MPKHRSVRRLPWNRLALVASMSLAATFATASTSALAAGSGDPGATRTADTTVQAHPDFGSFSCEPSSYEPLVAELREQFAGKAYRAILDDGATFLARMETCASGLSGQDLANAEFVRSQIHSLEAATYVRLHEPAKAVAESQAAIDAIAPALDDMDVLPEFRAQMRGLSQAAAKLRDDILSGRCDCSAH